MKGHVVATAQWRRLDGQGDDKCRLLQEPGGWLLAGHARFVTSGRHTRLEYILRCDSGWRCQSADIVGRQDGAEIGLRLSRSDAGWHVNGAADATLPDCEDLALCFTPCWLVMPLRRLSDSATGRICRAAQLDLAAATLTARTAGFDPLGEGRVIYRGITGGDPVELAVHESGFITHETGRWEGTAHAPA